MPKPNTYVQLLQAQKAIVELRRNLDIIKAFTVQQRLDVALIAKLDTLWKENFRHFHGALNCKNPDADVLQVHLDRRLADVYKNRQEMPPFEKRFPEIKPITYGRK